MSEYRLVHGSRHDGSLPGPVINDADTFARDRLPPRELWPDLLPAGLTYPERLNAAEALLDHDGPCVHGDDATWSYEQLRERSGRVARVLVEEMGLVPGNRVLLHGPNTPELIACWFGILRAGGVVVATMPLLRARELVKVIAKAQATHALVDGPLAAEVEAARAREPVLSAVKRFDEVDGRDGAFQSVPTAADDVALIAFTSGTTGEPKGCMHLHRDLLATCDTFGRHILDPQPDEVFSGTPPLAFTFGLGGLVLFPLRFGASTAPCAKPGPDALLEAIGRHGITTLFTAPTGYRAMLGKAAAGSAALDSLRVCVSAGEPLPAGVSDAWFERTGIRIIDGIGSTEMLHIFIASRPEDAKPGSTGTAVPGYEAMIVDAHMNPLPPGEIGRLAVRGPTGCRYLDDPRQSTYVVNGWNLTGDAFRMDADGYFWFQARTDDMIVSSGYNISGAEVESALLEHPAVAECAVVAAADEERGHVVKAFVVPAAGAGAGDALVADLQAHVKARIAPYKYPRRVEFLDALPRTPTGKVQRTRLRALDAEGR
jgi:2-aminobenzoate-CoA ligase